MEDIIFYHTYKGKRYTILATEMETDKWNLGIAKCHSDDRFEKKVGRSVAASHALVNPFAQLLGIRSTVVYCIKNQIETIISNYNRQKSNNGVIAKKLEEQQFYKEMRQNGWKEYLDGLYFLNEQGVEANPESEYPFFPGWWKIGEDESASHIFFQNKEQFFQVTKLLYS